MAQKTQTDESPPPQKERKPKPPNNARPISSDEAERYESRQTFNRYAENRSKKSPRNFQCRDQLWETYAATSGGRPEHWSNAFLVPMGETGNRFLLPNEHGELIIANLSPKGYEELSRAKVIEPTNTDPGRPVVWSYPAFANRCVVMRNDKEIVCVSMRADSSAAR